MATASIAAGPGRPRESGIWQYFKYLPEENKVFGWLTNVMVLNVASVINITITNTLTKLNFTLIL